MNLPKIVLAAGASLAMTIGGHASEIAPLAWKFRLIIIAAGTSNSPELHRQRKSLIAEQAALVERHIVLVQLAGDQATILLGPKIKLKGPEMRRELGLKGNEFAVVLIGKDTGVKLKADSEVSPAHLFELIDSMPMRQMEMRTSTRDAS